MKGGSTEIKIKKRRRKFKNGYTKEIKNEKVVIKNWSVDLKSTPWSWKVNQYLKIGDRDQKLKNSPDLLKMLFFLFWKSYQEG